jgi:septum formation protein
VSRLVLASASPVRALLLERAGLDIACDPAGLDEAEIKAAFRREGRDAADCAMALAEAKAARVARRHPGALVVGADQLLVCGETWLDKPADLAEARRQLQGLRGRRHELVTAVALRRDNAPLWRRIERPTLVMRDFSDTFLEAYLAAAGAGALGSLGAYQIEGLGVQLFTRIEGDYFTILGLPLLPLLDCLRGLGALAA